MRLAVRTDTWAPDKALFDALLDILPTHERADVLRYVQKEDRKRALLSRLMQRGICSQATGHPLR